MDANSNYLLENQYKDASKLNARIALHVRFSVNPEPWWEWVFRLMKLPKETRLLEVGTGPADFWRTNIGRIPDGWDVTLSDFSPGMLQQAQENLGDARERFTFSRINVQHIPFPDASFDGVIANFMLYHAPDLEQALREIQRVLKPGGRLYAATNGSQHMLQLNDLIRRLDPQAVIYTAASVFGLENGVEALHRHFPVVNRYVFDDALQVTDAEALLAYAFSMRRSQALAKNPDLLRNAIQQEIDAQGAFFIQKHSGLFEAVKA